MTDFVGSAKDAKRIREGEKRREEQRKAFEALKVKQHSENEARLKRIGGSFLFLPFLISSFPLLTLLLLIFRSDEVFATEQDNIETLLMADAIGVFDPEAINKKRLEIEASRQMMAKGRGLYVVLIIFDSVLSSLV